MSLSLSDTGVHTAYAAYGLRCLRSKFGFSFRVEFTTRLERFPFPFGDMFKRQGKQGTVKTLTKGFT